MPVRANTAVPGLFSVPRLLEPVRAVADDLGRVGVGLDVVDIAGLFPQAGDGGIGRPRPGLAALALNRRHQRRLLAADKRARPLLDLNIEIEVRPHDVLAQQPGLTRLRQRHLQALDRQRILGAAVDVALLGADGVPGDDHALDHGVGVAFQHRAIHKRAGIALIGVADHVLGPALACCGQSATSCRPGSLRRRARATPT